MFNPFSHESLDFIGCSATFYLPSPKADLVRDHIHDFLIRNYDAYTVESSDVQGFWRKCPNSPILHDHSLKYVVSFNGEERMTPFIDFLADICYRLREDCLYLMIKSDCFLVKPKEQT